MRGSPQNLPIDGLEREGAPEGFWAWKILRTAWLDAQHRGRNIWEFAVEMELLLGAGVDVNELRCWTDEGWVGHGLEVTQPRSKRRKFRVGRNLSFPKGTCFVLTEAGMQEAEKGLGNQKGSNGNVKKLTFPRWIHREGILLWGNKVIKKFRQPAVEQRYILDSFEELQWLGEIDDPLPVKPDMDPKERLRETAKSLNRKMLEPAIKFGCMGNGTKIYWKLRGKEEEISKSRQGRKGKKGTK
jgi:hypothetical protein